MTDLQREKTLVRACHDAIAAAGPDSIAGVLARFTAPGWQWRGMHPWHEQHGPAAVAAQFWQPFLTAFTRVQRRPDIFIAGLNEIDGFQGRWVVQMGHLMGLFDRPWLGIPPTHRIAMLRFAEFNRVEDDRIVETALFVDIPHLMMQAGHNPFPPQTGAQLVHPGPATHDGLCYEPQDPVRSAAALAAIDALVANPRASVLGISETERLHRVWHDDMIWWGPSGIGASYTIERYLRQHAAPFGAALMDGYRFNGHLCRMAEGDFGGYFGWPNLTLTNSGGFMGLPAGPGQADMRVVDLYRVADGKLAENWIFIDLLHWCAQQGLDVLGRMAAVAGGGG
ncbi:ester cyclase [Sphingomonas sp.]|uniref:nuclear transport factor 2 family protein n=1 Tax=Sphingomonas sp. TaxID=28214 RepID=UPI003CC66EC5